MVLNLSYIDSIAGSNIELRHKLIKILHQDLQDALNEFDKNLGLSNFEEIAKILHKTKHKIKMLNLIDFLTFTQDLEKKCSSKNISKKELDYFLQTLKCIIENLK